ncbi:MAG: MBL fold metallo-hydrolase [Lachnospiraceae bacterium]|nr:MBL fold metallo-hydrolase [Lachnospiraceae bacterium]
MRLHRNRILSIILAFLLLLGAFSIIPAGSVHAAATPAFQIDFINVGQGDAALVRCDGHSMLIDGGNSKQSSLIYSYLKQRSIDYIDVMVATHADADHVGGLSGALNYAKIGIAYCSVTQGSTKTFQNFVKYLNAQGKSITVPSAGDTFDLGSAKVTVLGPVKASSDDNNASIVLRIVYGNTSFLFAGDAEIEEEDSIIDSGCELESTVLKVAHHGSKSSSGYRFLREVSPQYAVISVGKDNSYGHPTEDVLSRLRDADVKTWRTDLQGHIICTSDGNTVSFTLQKNPDADTLAGAGAGQKSKTAGSKDQTIRLTPDTQADQTAPADRSIPSADASSAVDASEQAVQNTAPQEETYVLNTNTKKFHHPNCKSVNQMKDKNKEIFTGSRDDVIARGYVPCKNCNP